MSTVNDSSVTKIGKELFGKNFCNLSCSEKKSIIHPETDVDMVKTTRLGSKTLSEWVASGIEHNSFEDYANLVEWMEDNYTKKASDTQYGLVKIDNDTLILDEGILKVNITGISDVPIATENVAGIMKLGTTIPHTSTTYKLPVYLNESNRAYVDLPKSYLATSVQSNWLETDENSPSYIWNKPTVPAVNNPTITFVQYGYEVGSFSTNQDSDSTITLLPVNAEALTAHYSFAVADINRLSTDINALLDYFVPFFQNHAVAAKEKVLRIYIDFIGEFNWDENLGGLGGFLINYILSAIDEGVRPVLEDWIEDLYFEITINFNIASGDIKEDQDEIDFSLLGLRGTSDGNNDYYHTDIFEGVSGSIDWKADNPGDRPNDVNLILTDRTSHYEFSVLYQKCNVEPMNVNSTDKIANTILKFKYKDLQTICSSVNPY